MLDDLSADPLPTLNKASLFSLLINQYLNALKLKVSHLISQQLPDGLAGA